MSVLNNGTKLSQKPLKIERSDTIHTLSDRLVCPRCHTGLVLRENFLVCMHCEATYTVVDGIPDLRVPTDREKAEEVDWSQHWSKENQQSISQKFFSFYRKFIFARTVKYFLDRYFPKAGVFVEAGSGTAETSLRVNKFGGDRLLVAVDIVLPVLSMCHPIMDVRICGDIFHLPFRDASIDGIWNFGVMEHFTQDQINQIMREFYRVLRPEGRIILFWPATDSVPQKILRLLEKIINIRKKQDKFQFHPDEISQLTSMRDGRNVLARNSFDTIYIDYGFRSLMAFKTLVGEKS